MSARGRLGQSLARCPHFTALHASHNALPDAAGGALLDGLAERSAHALDMLPFTVHTVALADVTSDEANII